jgi:Carboxypeptidase regulatory-like domain
LLSASVDSIGASLSDWIGSVTPGVPLKVQPLGVRAREPGIDLRLVRAHPRAVPRTPLPPLIIDIDFLLTVQLADAAAEQKTLAELLLAAMQREDMEILKKPDALNLCVMLGCPAAPGLVLRTPFVRERVPNPSPRVRTAEIRAFDLQFIVGRVLGPGELPIEGARVSATGSGSTVQTDGTGTFRLPIVPGMNIQLLARAHGKVASGTGSAGEFVTLRLPLEV